MRGDRAGRRAYAQAIPVVGPGARARGRALPRAPARSPPPSPRVLRIVTSTPHDALVRGIFGEPRFMAEELRTVLPSELLATLQLDSLAPVDGSFIDEALRETSADLLFSVGLRGAGSGLVHVLFEHQSTPNKRMPLRLLRYQARI